MRNQQPCAPGFHVWESGSWGTIIGVSKCKVCGQVCRSEDFATLDAPGCQKCGTATSGFDDDGPLCIDCAVVKATLPSPPLAAAAPERTKS